MSEGVKRAKKPANKRKLTELYLRSVRGKKHPKPFLVWDTEQKGLALLVQRSGHLSFKVIYSRNRRARWYTIPSSIGLSDARTLARRVLFQVAEGKDPQSERQAQREVGTFAKLHQRYVTEHAQKRNKSWKQADALVRKHLLPIWGRMAARDIKRTDVKAMMGKIKAPMVANQVLAAASAVFTWGVKMEVLTFNPCHNVDRNKTKSRERVLSDSELPRFWAACDNVDFIAGRALRLILLTGQRPGEVSHMRWEHIEDGWWTMPGKVVSEVGWPGTKNGASHRVWLPKPAQDIIAELNDDRAKTGFVLAGARGRPISGLDAAMRSICAELGIDRATPHDLRRTHGTSITRLGFGRDGMNRIQNHREGGIGDIYDQHRYAKENQTIMETVADHLLDLVSGKADTNIIPAFGRKS
jgi:integrase